MKELYNIKDSFDVNFNSYLFHRRVCFRYINIDIFYYSACNKFNACLFI